MTALQYLGNKYLLKHPLVYLLGFTEWRCMTKHIISPKSMCEHVCYSRLLQNVWCKSAHIFRICRLVYIVMLMLVLAGCDTRSSHRNKIIYTAGTIFTLD